MRQVLDLHIHSRYSRACSPQLTLKNIEAACRVKGVDIIATGDFTYPEWFASINSELKETFSGSGLYVLKTAVDDQVKFILSTEVALIYKDDEKVRRIHLVIHAPNIAAVEKLNKQLDKRFNIRSDGRPILGIKAPELVALLLKIDPNFLIYPAHIWTPWFSVFGSKSGFNTLEECFKDQTKYIYAYETGLSSDPEMNWRLSALDGLTCLSNSDAHSQNNIAREANIMEISEPVSYRKIYDIIKNQRVAASAGQDQEGLKMTLEFYPEEGMYHFDGHRACNFSCEPRVSRQNNNLCPKCQKPLVIGVLNRVEELADRKAGFRPKNAVPFKKFVELDKIIAEALGVKSRNSLAVQKQYRQMIRDFGKELFILLDLDLEKITGIDSRITEGLRRVRAGELIISPGFDGEYGRINIFSESDKNKQGALL
ncbi:MAG: endonuclease Q family protein [bacterium]|nr:endonuclease Q family protein [bacterium]